MEGAEPMSQSKQFTITAAQALVGGVLRLSFADGQTLQVDVTPIVRQRTASAVALKDSILLALDGDGLRALCEADHDLGYIFMRRISNIVASRLLATRLQLYDLILQQPLPHL